jgi:hypothetical protein
MKTRSDELDAYFRRIADGSLAAQHANEVNLLSRPRVEELTRLFDSHPLVETLRGLVLDDADTSNHHVLATVGPVAGQVLYLSHDGDTRVVFASLDEFVEAAGRAIAEGRWLSELHPSCAPLSNDQRALGEFIESRVAEVEDDGVALALIPSLDLRDVALLQRLAVNQNFFVVEALADELRRRPSRELESIAVLCSSHKHRQAAAAGQAALVAIRAV